MTFRAYEEQRDKDAVGRIVRECGWVTDDQSAKSMDAYIRAGRGRVAEMRGAAECFVMTTPGTVRYLDEDLPLGVVSTVVTSRIARKRGFAGRLTAEAIAADVADGALVSALGMFEQGFYDKLGFGTGGYVHRFGFVPSSLLVPGAERAPVRLSPDDLERVHAGRLARRRGHGGCNITSPEQTLADLHECGENGFGLGFEDGAGGAITHQIWMRPRGSVEEGPYDVAWMAWRTADEFRELMGLIRNLGDQVKSVHVPEVAGVQLQDLVRMPHHQRRLTQKSPFDTHMRVLAYWQMRMNDVPRCLERTRLPGAAGLRFNARIADPIAARLDPDAPWRGTGGEYVVTLGERSSAEPGADPALPTLQATVNAFTRLWLGIRRATALELTDDLAGPPDLLEALDRALCLPDPQPDWDY